MKTFILQYMGIGHWFNFIDSNSFPVEFVNFDSALRVAETMAELLKNQKHPRFQYPNKLKDSTGKEFPLG